MNPYLYCSWAHTSLNHDIRQRMIFGGTRPSWSLKSIVPGFLLESFECAKDDRHLLFNDELQDCPGYQCRFCPEDNWNHACIIAKEDGNLILMDTNLTGSSSIINSYKAHNNCIFDIQWIDRHSLLTCSGDSSLRHHNLETNKVVSRLTSHTGSVKAVSLRPKHQSQLASCSRDGSVLLWDLRSKSSSHDNAGFPSLKPILSIHSAHHTDLPANVVQGKIDIKRKSISTANNNMTPKAVTSVNFIDDNTIVSSGASDGKIKFWDIRKLSKKNANPVKTITYPCNQDAMPGYTDLVVNKAGTMLFANCKDNYIYQYDLGSKNINMPKYRYTGHETRSFYLKIDLSPDEEYLVCGSSSFSPYIYRLGLVPQRPVLLNGHQGEVTVCRWSPGNQGVIVSISDDCTAMVHRMKPGSEYNVFTRATDGRRTADYEPPVSLSSRSGEETVNHFNQMRAERSRVSAVVGPLAVLAQPSLASSPSVAAVPLSLPGTPKRLKDQSIGSFLSPMAGRHQSPASTSGHGTPIAHSRGTLDELNNLQHTKMDRTSRSGTKVAVHGPAREKRSQRPDGPSDNKENIKRRKTLAGQPTIVNFLRPSNDR